MKTAVWMSRPLRSRRGMSLAAVLGITAFVVAAATTVFVVSFRQALYVDVSIENTEAYANAEAAVETTLAIIVREENLDPSFLAGLATYMGVTITDVGGGIYAVAGTVDADLTVTSYLAYVDNLITPYESFLQYTGSEPTFTLDPTVTPTTMLAAFTTEFFDTEYGLTAPAFTTYADIMAYYDTTMLTTLAFTQRTPASITGMANPTITVNTYCTGTINMPTNKSLTVTGADMFINGNLSLQNNQRVTVSEGNVLVIDGDLTLRNSGILTGTVIVTGSVLFNSSNSSTTERLYGTVYAGNDFTTDRRTVFGDAVNGPSFVFAVDDVNLDNSSQNVASGILYALGHDFYGNNAGVVLSGGVYAAVIRQISSAGIAADANLDAADPFYLYGVATNLLPTGGITYSFRYTAPAP